MVRASGQDLGKALASWVGSGSLWQCEVELVV